MEVQLTAVRSKQTSFTTGEPEAIFLCRHTTSTLPTWVANSFLEEQFLLLLIYDTKIWTDWSTKRIHIPVATKPSDDTPGQATEEESSVLCYFCAVQPQGSYHFC